MKERISYIKICLLCLFTFLLSCNSVAGDNISSDSINKSDRNDLTSTDVIALLGDSMTWIGGYNCEKNKGWNYYLRQAMPDKMINVYARSGATWTNTINTKGDIEFYSARLDDENVIYDQVLRLINDAENDNKKIPETIIIFAGANDALFSSSRPGLFNNSESLKNKDILHIKPNEVLTLAQSVELGCRLLLNKFKNSEIILVTPTQMSKASPEDTQKVGDIIESVGSSLNIKVLRADKNVNIRHEIEKRKNHKYTYDGIHTNAHGARLIADYILENINNSRIIE